MLKTLVKRGVGTLAHLLYSFFVLGNSVAAYGMKCLTTCLAKTHNAFPSINKQGWLCNATQWRCTATLAYEKQSIGIFHYHLSERIFIPVFVNG